MKVTMEDLESLGIDLKNRLHNKMKKAELMKLMDNIVSKKNIGEIVTLLLDEKYFSAEELLNALEKLDKKKFMELLDEPNNEKEMAVPVVYELNQQGYKVSQEVPLPKVGRARPRKMDVAGYKKKGIMKKISVTGVELKCSYTRSAIDSAFSQARDYLDYCERVIVAFSPLMYLKYKDVIEKNADREEDIGVWIVGKTRILKKLKDAYPREVSDKYQMSIVEYIDKGRSR